MTKLSLRLSVAEAKALLNASALALADEFDGTAHQRKALERAHEKLAVQLQPVSVIKENKP